MDAKLILLGFLTISLLMTIGCAVPATEQEAIVAPVAEPVELAMNRQRCFPTDALLQGLLRNHGEIMRGVGHVPVPVGQPPGFASLLISPGGSWSVIVSGAGGVSCLLVWGDKWKMAGPKGSV
jgi:hypothetical protein